MIPGKRTIGRSDGRPFVMVSVKGMRLVHYSAEPLGPLRVIPQSQGDTRDTFKPRGLWVSDDECEDNWPAWCKAESFGLDRLEYAYDVEMKADAKILVLQTASDIDEFTERWATDPPVPGLHMRMWIDWTGLREIYQGMIVTPYIWSRRLSMGDTPDAMWYYSWDCASGCIWDPAAIQSVTLRSVE